MKKEREENENEDGDEEGKIAEKKGGSKHFFLAENYLVYFKNKFKIH